MNRKAIKCHNCLATYVGTNTNEIIYQCPMCGTINNINDIVELEEINITPMSTKNIILEIDRSLIKILFKTQGIEKTIEAIERMKSDDYNTFKNIIVTEYRGLARCFTK